MTWPVTSSIWNSPIYCNINTGKVNNYTPSSSSREMTFLYLNFFTKMDLCLSMTTANFSLILAAARAVPGSFYGRGPPIILENVSCNGSEFTISQCNSSDFGRITNPQCSSPGNVAGVNCSIGTYHQFVVCMQCVCCAIHVTEDVYRFVIYLLQSAMMDQLDLLVV